MKRVFLSYSSKDRDFVNRLAMDIRARGFEVWYDQWELDVGDSLLSRIQEGIKQSSWLVVVLSPNANESRWVTEELNAGLAGQLAKDQVYILPVLYKDCELPVFLRDKVYADFREDYAFGLQRLLATLRRQYLERTRADSLRNLVDATRGALEYDWGRIYQRLPYYREPDYQDTERSRKFYFASYIEEEEELRRKAEEISSLELLKGIWVGPSGRLVLSTKDHQVTGEYDWQAIEFSGKLEGTLQRGALVFEWSWSVSGESGEGVFYWPIPERLIGGWWMKYDSINADDLLKAQRLPPNHWEFVRESDS